GAITPQHFGSELGQVAIGLRPPRQDDQEITLFKSVGVAIQDIATAHLVVQRAREAGLGTEIALSGA
ncbi:MAG: ornithine cyclodeaminase family protein, partial [Gaiellales bacterium]